MSHLNAYYDERSYLSPHDTSSFDMTMVLDAKPLFYPSENYLTGDYHNRLAHSMDQSIPAAHSFSYDDSRHTFCPAPYPTNSITIYDVHRRNDIRHPTPVRPISPTQLYPSGGWIDSGSEAYRAEPSAHLSSSMPSQPSVFVSPPTGSSSLQSVSPIPPQPHNPPPPSWAMSGSLDPATGVYQTAPEHPRVRTAQACDKCRGRKAKCSGEHPICQRCRLRGLKCEYASERKMRGPNKVKRKGGVNDVKTNRRMSVASLSSCSSEEPSTSPRQHRSPKSPFTTAPRSMSISSTSSDILPPSLSPSRLSSGSSSATQSPRLGVEAYDVSASPRAYKPRPPPLDLSCISPYEQMLPPPMVQPQMTSYGNETSTFHRRASLPSYLLGAYTHRDVNEGQSACIPVQAPEVLEDEAYPQFHRGSLDSYTSYLRNEMPAYSIAHSNSSGTSLSTPITPISSSPAEAELMYPLDFDPEVGFVHGAVDFSSFDPHFGNGGINLHDAWTGVDMDATPTMSSQGKERALMQLEYPLTST